MRFLLALALTTATIAAATLMAPQRAECAFCGNLTCVSSSNCYQGCACVGQIGNAMCVGTNAIPDGASVLP